MNNIRREKLRDYIEANQVVTIEELTKLLPDVSLMTIHRDLNYLQQQGFIAKVRGGARYLSGDSHEPAFFAREVVNQAAKEIIAEKALPLLSGSSSIFLDAGTTMMTFARLIPDRTATVLTTGPNVALELSSRQDLTISMCGGVLNKSNLTLSGSAALDAVSKVNIDTAFLVATGYSEAGGFTCGREDEARIKTQVISQSRTTIMLLDTSKIERMLPYTFAVLEDFHYVVTEKDPRELPEAFLQAAKHSSVQVL